MNAKLGQHMTLLGLCAMVFYGLMLGTGNMTLEVMPQFVISAVIFLTSGRLMKKGAFRQSREADSDNQKNEREEPDWAWLTLLLNWLAALTVVGLMAIMLMKPIGVSLLDTITESMQHKHFFADSVP